MCPAGRRQTGAAGVSVSDGAAAGCGSRLTGLPNNYFARHGEGVMHGSTIQATVDCFGNFGDALRQQKATIHFGLLSVFSSF